MAAVTTADLVARRRPRKRLSLEYDPASLVADLERIARVQAIKCSPMRERGTPTQAMWENCPPRFLMPELRALAPGALLVFGGEARWVVERHGNVRYTTTGPDYRRGTLQVDRHVMDLFVLPHPSAWGGKWARGQAQLVDDLVASPLNRH
jgi:uracil-DNA glycosylase